MKKTIGIIGMGLIGGSISLGIKARHGKDVHIVGVDVDQVALEEAMRLGVIDEVSPTVSQVASEADVLVIATPVSKSIEMLTKTLMRVPLKTDLIITDTGSTKSTVLQAAEPLVERGVTFIGGHPMAGSHKSGVQGARHDLFENAFYILTLPKQDEKERAASEEIQRLLAGTNARFVEMGPGEHDEVAGSVSHLPHIVASALVHQLHKVEQSQPMIRDLAAGGFRDITRIASANPVMWRDILLQNREVLTQMMVEWQQDMESITELIRQGDAESLFSFFDGAKRHRDDLPVKTSGAIPALKDLYVDVPDHPGVISDVTGILAEHGISITNIRIIEAREDIMGVLRLTFRTTTDRERGQRCLENEHFSTYKSE
ncbi:prephenate dehydrogenase [Geomicrobium sp. JCM 19039]|uniref:prephenate dehydrogenase n=1 Tax=Geomicrobium sp. JCM 19039 TaxID=1460636 RepID=UPI00045F238D|nr:prephenate dehydrogenase [Geomicrobium sp. JCM 19039]GAK11212.1 prephenate dehydrogenase [Geomicrobium sp. JCM 19039]